MTEYHLTLDYPAMLTAKDEEIARLDARIAELEASIDANDEWAKGFIEKTDARIAELEAALLRIGQPGKKVIYCRDGHEEAVLLARAAYRGEKG